LLKHSELYDDFAQLAVTTVLSDNRLAEWWKVLTHGWLRDDMKLVQHALHNLSAECFAEVSELSNVPVDHVVSFVIDTFKRKNAAYGNDTLANFYRVERDFEIVPMVGLITRMSDKMSRIENLLDDPDLEKVGEALQDTYTDLGAYALIAIMIIKDRGTYAGIDDYKYAEAGVNVDDPVMKTGVIDEYRKYL